MMPMKTFLGTNASFWTGRAATQARDSSEGTSALRWIPERSFASPRMTAWFQPVTLKPI
ncbi:hypothetical protein C8D03_1389 [Bosea sp. 124]|nr:hypothetical protein C8D03_1389 [Bosea sp. 124]